MTCTLEANDLFLLSLEHNISVKKLKQQLNHVFVSDYFSWRNRNNGSWFIQALSSVLAKHWQDMDLLTILTRMNKKMGFEYESCTDKEFMNGKKQIPCITSMLTKEIRFKPE